MDGKLRCMTSVYLSKSNKMLLLYPQGSSDVNNLWIGSAGGHFEKDELNDAGACVLRELEEETGLTENEISELSLRYVTLKITKGELRQNYYFFAELKEHVDTDIISNEGICKWFDYDELNSLEMPFTAQYVIRHYLETGRLNDKVYGGIADGEKVVFIEMPEF